ncbi:hypothetical protein [Vibrio mexicanus]|uniref:hypothetical protein n=1 Tax=Vibrio mexicanus TaxID=1004326 RepID=UPI00063CDB0D|nr:hypothetical protein [Vibrio mexicanus]
MSMNTMKMVTAPLIRSNGFALLFSQQRSSYLKLPLAPVFEKGISFSIGVKLEPRQSNAAWHDDVIPLLQLSSDSSDEGSGAFIDLHIKNNQIQALFVNEEEALTLLVDSLCETDKWINIAVCISESGFHLFVNGAIQASASSDSIEGLATINQGLIGWPSQLNDYEINNEPTYVNSAAYQVKFLRFWRADIYHAQQANTAQSIDDLGESDEPQKNALIADWRYQPSPSSMPTDARLEFGMSDNAPQWVFNPDDEVIDHCPLPLVGSDDINALSTYQPVYHLAAPQDPARKNSAVAQPMLKRTEPLNSTEHMDEHMSEATPESTYEDDAPESKSKMRIRVRKRYRR